MLRNHLKTFDLQIENSKLSSLKLQKFIAVTATNLLHSNRKYIFDCNSIKAKQSLLCVRPFLGQCQGMTIPTKR